MQRGFAPHARSGSNSRESLGGTRICAWSFLPLKHLTYSKCVDILCDPFPEVSLLFPTALRNYCAEVALVQERDVCTR